MGNQQEYQQVKHWAERNGFALVERSFLDFHHELIESNRRLASALENTGDAGPPKAAFERLRLEWAAEVYSLRQQNRRLRDHLDEMARLCLVQIPPPTVIINTEAWDEINRS